MLVITKGIGGEVNGLLEVANIWPLEVGQFSRILGINRKFAPKNEKSSPGDLKHNFSMSVGIFMIFIFC